MLTEGLCAALSLPLSADYISVAPAVNAGAGSRAVLPGLSQRSSAAQWVQPCQCMVVAVCCALQAIGFFSLLKWLFLLVPVSCPAGLALAVRSKTIESCRLRKTLMIPKSNYHPDLLSPIIRSHPLMPCPCVSKNGESPLPWALHSSSLFTLQSQALPCISTATEEDVSADSHSYVK